jgi:hypothetical protein
LPSLNHLASRKMEDSRKAMAPPAEDTPPSSWVGRCHRREPTVSKNVHEFFLEHWSWRSDRVKDGFPKQGLATWHCCNYPDSLDDRIEPGAFFCTVLFLVDGKYQSRS